MANFSKFAVYRDKNAKNGFRRQAFIFYHGTSGEAASSIIKEGFFRVSSGTKTLGNGIYVTSRKDKARVYSRGQVILKVVAYVGHVATIKSLDDSLRKTWQGTHDSAWLLPPDSVTSPSELPVKSCIRKHFDCTSIIAGNLHCRRIASATPTRSASSASSKAMTSSKTTRKIALAICRTGNRAKEKNSSYTSSETSYLPEVQIRTR